MRPEQRAQLSQVLADAAGRGWRVESQTDTHVVLVRGRRPRHLLHLILTILTGGAWALLVWLPLWAVTRERRLVLELTEDGLRDVRGRRWPLGLGPSRSPAPPRPSSPPGEAG